MLLLIFIYVVDYPLIDHTNLPKVFDTPINDITKLAFEGSILRSIFIISGRYT